MMYNRKYNYMKTKQHFYNHIFFYIISFFLLVTIFNSFYRFIIKNDYIVYYEDKCDPYTESCFMSCEADSCIYYKKIQKYALNVYTECGNNITNCYQASVCLKNDKNCSITYCNLNIDSNCEFINNSRIQNN